MPHSFRGGRVGLVSWAQASITSSVIWPLLLVWSTAVPTEGTVSLPRAVECMGQSPHLHQPHTRGSLSHTHIYMPMCPTPASPTPHHFWNSSCPLAGGSRVLMSQLNLICHLFLGDVQIGNSSIINEVLIALCNQFPRDAVWLLGWVFQHELPHLLRPGTWIRMMGHPTVSRVPSCPHRWAEQ